MYCVLVIELPKHSDLIQTTANDNIKTAAVETHQCVAEGCASVGHMADGIGIGRK